MGFPAIKSEHVLNFSGATVTILVIVLGAYTVTGTPIFPFVVILGALQLVCFLSFLALENRHSDAGRFLFWIEAVLISWLFFLIPTSFIAILSMVWLVQAASMFQNR